MKFELSPSQLDKLGKWMDKHEWRPIGTIGGTYTYSFTLTTLGVVCIVKNNANGHEIDLTPYEDW